MNNYDTLDGDDHFHPYSPVCTPCIHKISCWPRTCKAFATRIPDEIWFGKTDHTQAYEGDQGILFERRIPKTVSADDRNP